MISDLALPPGPAMRRRRMGLWILGDTVRQPRTVARTADIRSNNRDEGYNASMDGFIEKPLDLERFFDTVVLKASVVPLNQHDSSEVG